MLKFAKLAALALVGVFAASAVQAEDKPAAASIKGAASVNGVIIPQARIDLRVKVAASQGQTDSPELRKMILDDMVNLEVMSQEAVKKGLDKQSDTLQQIELARQSALAGAYVQDYTKNHPISEDALKQEYDTLKSKLGNTEYKVAHILVATEEEAKAAVAQIKKVGFAKVAKDKSKDPGSAAQGGELGWHPPVDFVPQFSGAMVQLKKGQTSTPVQSQFGWHIIKLEDTRNLNVPPFEQVKPNLMQRLQQQSVQKAIADLRSGAKIE